MSSWKKISIVDFEHIRSVKNSAHLAVQNVSALGRCYSPKSPRDEHGVLQWVEELQRLAGKWVSNEKGKIRSSFSFQDFSIYLIDDKMETISRLGLEGKKHTDVMIWLEEHVANQGFDISPLHFNLPYDVPLFSRIRNKAFSVESSEYLLELAAYYNNANLICEHIKSKFVKASDIRCWPHHFDLATLITIQDSGDPETSSTLGIGMSPGDDLEKIPYFYVTPWPYPSDLETPRELPIGKWVQDQWVGAKLDMQELTQYKSASDQHQIVISFIDESIHYLSHLFKGVM